MQTSKHHRTAGTFLKLKNNSFVFPKIWQNSSILYQVKKVESRFSLYFGNILKNFSANWRGDEIITLLGVCA